VSHQQQLHTSRAPGGDRLPHTVELPAGGHNSQISSCPISSLNRSQPICSWTGSLSRQYEAVEGWLGLVDVEMPGYGADVQEPEDEQDEREQADDGQRYD
jgi:hypothetical protein